MVVHARTGDDAITAFTADPAIDLVLMDIELDEGSSGVEAAERILSHRSVPIVFLTDGTESDTVDGVRKVARYGYLVKSANVFVVKQTIALALELYAQRQTRIGANRAFRVLSDLNRRLLEADSAYTELSLSAALHGGGRSGRVCPGIG